MTHEAIMYEIVFDEDAIAFLEKQHDDIRKRIFEKILFTKENPFRFFDRLVGRTDYKMRVGVYRIIADIDAQSKTIRITLIGHRKNIYK